MLNLNSLGPQRFRGLRQDHAPGIGTVAVLCVSCLFAAACDSSGPPADPAQNPSPSVSSSPAASSPASPSGAASAHGTPPPASSTSGNPSQTAAGPGALPPVGHVFIINLENKSFDEIWGKNSKAPYLSGDLRSEGVLLTNYYAVAHHSLPNYLAQISGQGPNPKTEDDCPTFVPVTGKATRPQADNPGQAPGSGCVYPANVPTIANQLSAAGRSWKGYMEDMGTPCQRPELGKKDPWHGAKAGNAYATRHNPFVYFRAVTDSPDCTRNVVDLAQLNEDLLSPAVTPNYSYITPNLCNDGHDSPCKDGRRGGLETADAWLRDWVPRITASPAFAADGLLVITFDEARMDSTEQSAPSPSGLPGMGDPDGGRVGTLVMSPFTAHNGSSAVPYNHYSLLASIEDLFNLPHLGYAADAGLNHFGSDIYTAPGGSAPKP
jgi:hypothetical protein